MADNQTAEEKAKQAEAKKKADEAKKAEAAKKKQEAAAEKKANESKTKYFRCKTASGLTIRKEDGSKVRFSQYFDTYKGDRVRVGLLATSDSEVVKRCQSLDMVEEIEKGKYNDLVKELSRTAS